MIIAEQAEIIRRIFREYVAGQSPRTIARQLNAEGIRGPRGGFWSASLILGNADRGTGILRNRLYAGERVWNKQRYIRHPVSRKRQARLNPQSEWLARPAPELRILDDEIWENAQARLKENRQAWQSTTSNPLNVTHRPKYLLTGLMRCDVCDGPVASVAPGGRLGCANHRERGTCTNRRTVARAIVEGRVLIGIKHRLLAPELVERFVRTYTQELNDRSRAQRSSEARLSSELTSLNGRISRFIKAIGEGLDTPAMRAELIVSERRKAEIEQELKSAPQALPTPHPNLPELYRRMVERLEEALEDPSSMEAARELIRRFIDKIVFIPGEARGEFRLQLHGDLAALMAIIGDPESKDRTPVVGSAVSLVAGARNQRDPSIFRIEV